jgi:hypothetical protein
MKHIKGIDITMVKNGSGKKREDKEASDLDYNSVFS